MSLSSIPFIFHFLPIFIICVFIVPGRLKNLAIIMGSLFVYAWGEPVYVGLLVLSIMYNYILGVFIGISEKKHIRKIFLFLSILSSIALILYCRFEIIMLAPVGVIVYTLQNLSYIFDVYRGRVEFQTNFIDYATYASLFPQFQAGLIVKYHQIKDQLKTRERDYIRIKDGVAKMVTGLAKKVLIADQLSALFSKVLDININRQAGSISIATVWLGAVCALFSLYFEFSGLSDMAVGLNRCLGFNVPENFNYPLMSKSVSDFCRRWFMSISGWIKEYIYCPLGGNKKTKGRSILNICLCWGVAIGLFGFNLNYLVCGVSIFLIVLVEKLVSRADPIVPVFVRRTYTWFALILCAVIFKTATLSDSVIYLKSMFCFSGANLIDDRALFWCREYLPVILVAVIASFPFAQNFIDSVKERKTGYAMAIYRFTEKLFLVGALLLSVAYLASGGAM